MKTKKITLVALFIALSFIGSNIKIVSSIAFDSMPGFLISIMLGPIYGAIVGLLGHLLTALTSGFPMTIPIHLIIGIFMAITIYVFGVSYRILKDKNKLLSWLVPTLLGVTINGPVTVYFLINVINVPGLAYAIVPILSLAALANIIVAIVIYTAIPKRSLAEFKQR